MLNASTIRAVFLDYGGTLDADGLAWKDRFCAIYRAAGLDVDQSRFDRAFYDADDSLLAERVWSVSLTEIVREQVARVLGHLDAYTPRLHERVVDEFLEASTRQLARNEPVLERLQRKYRLGIISNNYGNLASICRQTGLDRYFDVLIDSNEVGCTKPDPRIFAAGLDALGVPAEQAMMVGDSLPRDMHGARDVGMAHAWLTPPGRAERTPCCAGDPVISELAGILEVLEA